MPGCRTWQEVAGAGAGLSINRDSPQAQGLRLWWPLHDAAPGAAVDLAGTKNALTLQAAGMRYVGSRFRGLQFNGSSQYASSAALDLSFSLSRGVTLSAWVSTTSDYNAVLVAASASGGSHLGLYAGWTGLDAATAGKVAGGFHNVGTWTDQYVYGTSDIDDGVLRHLAATYNASTNEMKVYVNGTVEGSNTFGATPASFSGPEPMYFGRYPLAAVEYMTGYAYDPRVYNRHMSDAEVMSLYSPLTRYDLYWRKSRSAPRNAAAAASTIGFLRDNAGCGAVGGGPFARANAGLGAVA